MLEHVNVHSQPVERHPVFNNWDVIPEAWYFTVRSRDLKKEQVISFRLQNQQLAIFRSQSGKVSATDAFCPHMGTDLAQGKVVGEHIRCFFHHWEFDGKGLCRKIPCLGGKSLESNVGLTAYPTCEKYGLIWVYAGQNPTAPVLEVPDLEGKEIIFHLGTFNQHRSHHHLSMVNGLDPQHLKTVHGLSLDMDLQMEQTGQQLECTLEGLTTDQTLTDRFMRWAMGPKYSYSMKYSQASVASLTLLRDVYFRNPKWIWPRLHMLYAYRPEKPGLSSTQTIYVTEKRRGLLGWIKSYMILFLTSRAYAFLKDEDDKVYDHIRFTSRRMLAIDQPLVRYIAYVNQLKASAWAKEPSGMDV